MSYVRKLGASALVIAAAFAVAFAVLVSSTTTDTVEAATIDVDAADTSGNAAPGDTVRFTVAGTLAQLEITGTAEGVSASFVANGGQKIDCGDNASCDTDDSDTTTAGRQNVEDQVRVVMKVAADAGEGHILVRVEGIGLASGNTEAITKVINVSKSTLVGSLAIKADDSADKTIAADEGVSNLTVTVKNASSPAGLLAGQSVAVTTTHGTVGCADTAGSAAAGDSQTCSIATGEEGIVDVLLTGGGVEGQATVTATLGTRTATVTVTLFGDPKNLTAEPMQSSVEIGGSVFIVLTVTDGAGNPISGQTIEPVTSKEVAGPAGVDNPVLVTTEKATAASDSSEEGVGYSKDYIAPKAANNIPACGDDNTGTLETPSEEAFTADGTNAAGKCVVEVTAPAATATAKAATRGVHTLNFQITAAVKASTTIEVAGAPASIMTDAPAMVDPASVTEITVSVFDDEDVLVGITDVRVRKVDGGGLVEDAGDGGVEKTSNGKSKFSFVAPSTAGTAEIIITAGKAPPHRVTVQIGEAEAAPEPAAPSLSPAPAGDDSLVTFSGGTVAEFAAALADACGDDARAYATDYQGEWVSFIPAAPGPVNAAFNALFADGIDRPLLITSCN